MQIAFATEAIRAVSIDGHSLKEAQPCFSRLSLRRSGFNTNRQYMTCSWDFGRTARTAWLSSYMGQETSLSAHAGTYIHTVCLYKVCMYIYMYTYTHSVCIHEMPTHTCTCRGTCACVYRSHLSTTIFHFGLVHDCMCSCAINCWTQMCMMGLCDTHSLLPSVPNSSSVSTAFPIETR